MDTQTIAGPSGILHEIARVIQATNQSSKAKFYTTKMYQCKRDNKALFRIMDGLMKRKALPKCPNTGAGTVQLAEDFLEFFKYKMFANRSQLASICLQIVHTLDGPREQLCKVSVFTGIRLDAAHRIVFDQLPIAFVKVNFHILAATLATIIIMSLESGSEPANFKHVVVTPLLNTSRLSEETSRQYQTYHLRQSYWSATCQYNFASTRLFPKQVYVDNITALRRRWCAFRVTFSVS